MTAAERRRGTAQRLVLAVLLVVGGLTSTASAAAHDDHELTDAAAEETTYLIVFPVSGESNYGDTFGAPRSGGRTHKGTDIFAPKGTPVVAAAAGTVVRMSTGTRAGRYMVLRHEGGWHTYYLHLNNDTDGTDDGLGGAPAEGIAIGVEVEAGTVLDYVGDSGNAEETPPHLHFEIRGVDGVATNPYPHLRAAQGRPVTVSPPLVVAAEPAYTAANVQFVGHLDPGGGFATDVAVHDEVAYLGTWGRPRACPASGVRMIDVTDPAEPAEIGAIATGAEFSGTSTDSVWVGAIDTPDYDGDLAVVGLRLCDTSERNRRSDRVRGLALYDVTDTEEPTLLGTYDSGHGTQGIHEFDVVTRADGSVLVAAAAPQSVRHTSGETGDLRIVDITDPATPVELSNWDLRRDGELDEVDTMLTQLYDELELHTHSATWSDDGAKLWLANWDAGVVLLDTTDPTQPEVVTMFGFDPESVGNAHSVIVDPDAGLLIRNDEDLINADVERHGAGWGGQRIYDVSDIDAPVEVGSFRTERAASNGKGSAKYVDGRYSAHDAQIVDGVEYVAWYSDGLRIVDLSDPAAPQEIGSFVPPAYADPNGYWTAPDGNRAFAMTWGVDVADALIYVSDMHSGLWIVRYAPPNSAAEIIRPVAAKL